MSKQTAARMVLMCASPALLVASFLVAVLGVSWLWAFWLLGVALLVEVAL